MRYVPISLFSYEMYASSEHHLSVPFIETHRRNLRSGCISWSLHNYNIMSKGSETYAYRLLLVSSITKNTCIVISASTHIADYCEDRTWCYFGNNTYCVNNKCTCLPGHIPDATDTGCLKCKSHYN